MLLDKIQRSICRLYISFLTHHEIEMCLIVACVLMLDRLQNHQHGGKADIIFYECSWR